VAENGTATPLTPQTDPHWMQLSIDLDRNKSTGWEGYEFKWIDSPVQAGNITDDYLNGEAAPSGRFNFHYLAP
jgi:hypothetical protein